MVGSITSRCSGNEPQWRIQGRGLGACSTFYFKTKLRPKGPKKIWGTPAPLILRSGSGAEPYYIKLRNSCRRLQLRRFFWCRVDVLHVSFHIIGSALQNSICLLCIVLLISSSLDPTVRSSAHSIAVLYSSCLLTFFVMVTLTVRSQRTGKGEKKEELLSLSLLNLSPFSRLFFNKSMIQYFCLV